LLLLANTRRVRTEHCDGLNLDQQFRPAEDGLDAGGRWQRIEPQLLEECGTFLVECIVVALDVAQVASGAHNIVPGAAFARQQSADIGKGTSHLGAKVRSEARR